MKVIHKVTGKIATLESKNFLAQGGEGSLYVKDSLVYKICDPDKMISEKKLNELSTLDHKCIIRPLEIVENMRHIPCGYTMRHVPDTYTLCQLFPKAFRIRHNVRADTVFSLVKQMQSTIDFVHKNKIHIVDLNELNFLVDKPLKNVYFIDVNSYATANYPATVIMDNIRDRHAKTRINPTTGKSTIVFDELTDWFSFAIISFMMFVGMHPFKGRHPKFTDPSTSLDLAMQHHKSILNPEVKYPKGATMPLNVIPDVYRRWYEALFERGLRLPPPTDVANEIQVNHIIDTRIKSSRGFVIQELANFAAQILRVCHLGQHEIVVTATHVHIDRKAHSIPNDLRRVQFSSTKSGRIIACDIYNQRLRAYDVTSSKDIPLAVTADDILESNGLLYIKSGDNLTKMQVMELADRFVPSFVKVGDVLDNATHFYDGCIFQLVFGVWFVSFSPRGDEYRQMPLNFLKDYKVVDARYQGGVLMVLGVNLGSGRHDRFTLRFTADSKEFHLKHDADVGNAGINFAVLNNGIAASINEDGALEVFRACYDPDAKLDDYTNRFLDPVIESDMNLCNNNNRTLFFRGSKLYSITAQKSK